MMSKDRCRKIAAMHVTLNAAINANLGVEQNVLRVVWRREMRVDWETQQRPLTNLIMHLLYHYENHTIILTSPDGKPFKHKGKTKVTTVANHNRRKQRNEPIRTRSKHRRQPEQLSAGNACEQVTSISNQSQSVVRSNGCTGVKSRVGTSVPTLFFFLCTIALFVC